MKKKIVIMDGNEAAAYVSYAFTEVAGIFPITPSSPMAEHVDAGRLTVKRTSSASRYRWWRCSPRVGRPVRSMVPCRPVP